MTTDLKIELFSKDMFDALWTHHGLRKRKLPTSKCPPPARRSEFTLGILRAVQAQMALYHPTYEAWVNEWYYEFAGNHSEFYAAICRRFPPFAFPPSTMAVMGIFLHSCAFVALMCLCSFDKEDLLDLAHKAWSMFVDLNLKDDFYHRGGWETLRKFADVDAAMYDFVRSFSDVGTFNAADSYLLHQPHLTVASLTAYDEFQLDWEGIEDCAPLALEWADYCVHVPFMKIHDFGFYQDMAGDVLDILENSLFALRDALDPQRKWVRVFEDDDDDDSWFPGPPEADTEQSNKSPPKYSNCSAGEENSSGFPIPPMAHSGTGHAEPIETERFHGLDGEVLAMANPKNILETEDTVDKSIHAQPRASKSEESLTAEKSNNDNENLSPLDIIMPSNTACSHDSPIQTSSTSLLDNMEGLEESFEEAASDLSSLAVVITTNDRKTNIDPNDLATFMNLMELEKFVIYAPPDSKRKVEVYKKNTDLGSSTVSDNSVEETPEHSLTLHESPRTSPNLNVLSNDRKSLFTPPNLNVLSNPLKSPLTSPNLNVLSNPLKSPMTSPNLNVLSKPLKSPLNSSNLNVLSNHLKSPLTSSNLNILYNARKSPLTSPDVNISTNPDFNLQMGRNTSGLSGSKKKSSSGKENSPLTKSKCEIKTKSPHQKYANVCLIPSDSSREADNQQLNVIEENITVKDSYCTRRLYLDIDDPSNDEIKTIVKPIVERTLEPPETNKGVEKNSIDPPKDLPISSTDPMLSSSSITNQNSVIKTDHNDPILEKSLKLFEPKAENEPPRPPQTIECEPKIQQTSQSANKPLSTEVNDPSAESSHIEVVSMNELCSNKLLQDNTERTSEDISNEPSFDQKEEKSKKELNSIQADEGNENAAAAAEPALENPSGLSAQDSEKKGKKRKAKKRLSRLEERVREEGDAVRDVMRLILVMGHRPGYLSVAAAMHNSRMQLPKDDGNEN